ncbi:MAG: hypothetical protein L3J82_00635 [Planctomycetes bacterium]|nr:hypothetical protein [Planctomycetota bacterium]
MPETETKAIVDAKAKMDIVCQVMGDAVCEALEKKMKLGQYAVIADENGQPKSIGPEEIAELLKNKPKK